MAATHKGLMEIALAILDTWHAGRCSKSDAKSILLCLLRQYSDPGRVVEGRPHFDVHVSLKALASSDPAHREHAVPLDYIATVMVDEATPVTGSPVVSALNIPASLHQVIMLKSEHDDLNKSKSLKQGMPTAWNGHDMFARYAKIKDFEFSGATEAQVRALQKRINVAEGREKAKMTRKVKKI